MAAAKRGMLQAPMSFLAGARASGAGARMRSLKADALKQKEFRGDARMFTFAEPEEAQIFGRVQDGDVQRGGLPRCFAPGGQE
jgi:hypothetical protein